MIKIRRKKTKAKPVSEAQKRARERNWNKGQILCMRAIADKICKSKTTPNAEKIALTVMMSQLTMIHKNWNKS